MNQLFVKPQYSFLTMIEKMKVLVKCCSILLLQFVCSAAIGQTPQAEVNAQVWEPFIKHFNDNNTEGFMAVHWRDLVRSPRDGKTVLNWNEYFTQQQAGDKRDREAKQKRTLELRFTERIYGNNQAVEVGVYKTSYLKSDGSSQSFYGRFHVVLRKESGVWKILVDTDSSENNSITETDFLKAAPLKL